MPPMWQLCVRIQGHCCRNVRPPEDTQFRPQFPWESAASFPEAAQGFKLDVLEQCERL